MLFGNGPAFSKVEACNVVCMKFDELLSSATKHLAIVILKLEYVRAFVGEETGKGDTAPLCDFAA